MSNKKLKYVTKDLRNEVPGSITHLNSFGSAWDGFGPAGPGGSVVNTSSQMLYGPNTMTHTREVQQFTQPRLGGLPYMGNGQLDVGIGGRLQSEMFLNSKTSLPQVHDTYDLTWSIFSDNYDPANEPVLGWQSIGMDTRNLSRDVLNKRRTNGRDPVNSISARTDAKAALANARAQNTNKINANKSGTPTVIRANAQEKLAL